MNEKWQNKIEKDIQGLTLSINKLALSLEHFIQHSKEMQDEKFSQIEKILNDHEERIRHNSKFVYQAMAAGIIVCMLIGWILKFI